MGRAVTGWGPPRRRLIPGWVWLLGAFAVLFAGVYFPWRDSQDFAPVTFRPWTCAAEPGTEITGPPAEERCTPSAPGLELQLFEANGARDPDSHEGDAVVFEDVSSTGVDFSLQVRLDAPADEVLLHPAAHGDETLSAFHGDASGQHWTSYWRPSGRRVFDVLVVRGRAE